MSADEPFRYEKRGPIAVMTIDRPEAMNAFTLDMLEAMEAAFADFEADPELFVAILTGTGDRAFTAGMDLKESLPELTSGQRKGYSDPTKRPFSDVFKPIICAVNGACIAGGVEFMLGTDLRIAVPHATFGLGEVRWGLIPTGGSHIRLPRQVPWAVAMEMLLTGGTLDAQRALTVGLVNQVVAPERLMPAAFELAERMCENGPLAMRTAKEIAVRALDLEAGFVLEKALEGRVLGSADAREGPLAFSEKRKPRFRGE